MLTREQAAETWCPMVRIARHEVTSNETPMGNMTVVSAKDHVVGGCNSDALGRLRVPASCRCIADKCAMWRWGEAEPAPKETKKYPRRGYCGLAGRPA